MEYSGVGAMTPVKEQVSLYKENSKLQNSVKSLNVLSLFSGCGGMDLGFEGGFEVFHKCINPRSGFIDKIEGDFIRLKTTRFRTVFANDILKEAFVAWKYYFKKYGYDSNIYHQESIVDLVKMHKSGANVFPADVDVVTGGFPCQDFSVAGKRKGFNSSKDHNGNTVENQIANGETTRKALPLDERGYRHN